MTTQSNSLNDELFFNSLVQSYVEMPLFVQRSWLEKQVKEELAHPDCRFLLLTAEPGAGKSAFMAQLAHHHNQASNRWCRYFIRRDQQTPLGDPGSHSFLLQIGFQLVATYPHLFDQEQVQIKVDQRIGEALDSKIVGAKVEELFASPFYQEVIQIQQEITRSSNTQVIGVRVEKWYTDSRLIPLNNLQFMALIAPANALLKHDPSQQIVILVDALDELHYHVVPDLLKWLANCPKLPPNLRFVLTSRPDDALLSDFRGTQKPYIREIELKEDNPEVAKDLSKGVHLLIETQPKVQQTLANINSNVDVFTTQVVEKANGNFGYLDAIGRAVVQAIKKGKDEFIQEILSLSQLPGSLQELYAFFLTKIKTDVNKNGIAIADGKGEVRIMPAWPSVYKPILGVLSVSREPLTLDQIQELGAIKVERDYLIGAIENLRQFLNLSESHYRLYHSTLPEFLIDPATRENTDTSSYYIDAVKQNSKIVNYFWAKAKSLEVNLEKLAKNDYGRRHLAQHMVQANRVEDLHTLLSLETEGKNAWFKLKDDEGDTTGFLADLELAWLQADQDSDHEPGKNIGLQCRYALIKASINSLSEIPAALFAALVKHPSPYWKVTKALAYARQVPEPWKRSASLGALAGELPDAEPLKPQILQSALDAASAAQDWYRALALTALADKLPPDLLPKALDAAIAIQTEYHRVETLAALADKLPPDLLPKALDAALAIDPHECAHGWALAALADKLPPDLLPKALDAALALQDEYARAEVLTALAAKLPEVLPQALDAAMAIDDEPRAIALTALADKLPEVLPQALDAAMAIDDKYARAKSLTALADKFSPDLLLKALDVGLALQDGEYRARTLTALADKLPEVLPQALDAAMAIDDETDRAKSLTALADKLPGVLPQALDAAMAIDDETDRTKALMELSTKLPPDLLPQALDAALALQDGEHRANVLINLVDKLTPDLLPKALDAALAIDDKSARAIALTALSDKLPEILPQALDAALALQDGE